MLVTQMNTFFGHHEFSSHGDQHDGGRGMDAIRRHALRVESGEGRGACPALRQRQQHAAGAEDATVAGGGGRRDHHEVMMPAAAGTRSLSNTNTNGLMSGLSWSRAPAT